MVEKFSDMFSRFDTIPECDGHPATQPPSQPPSHVAVAITLNALAKASSLKRIKRAASVQECSFETSSDQSLAIRKHYLVTRSDSLRATADRQRQTFVIIIGSRRLVRHRIGRYGNCNNNNNVTSFYVRISTIVTAVVTLNVHGIKSIKVPKM